MNIFHPAENAECDIPSKLGGYVRRKSYRKINKTLKYKKNRNRRYMTRRSIRRN